MLILPNICNDISVIVILDLLRKIISIYMIQQYWRRGTIEEQLSDSFGWFFPCVVVRAPRVTTLWGLLRARYVLILVTRASFFPEFIG